MMIIALVVMMLVDMRRLLVSRHDFSAAGLTELSI